MSAEATLAQAKAQLRQAQVNLERTRILSPVDGYVTNLLAQLGDYVNVGANTISLVDAGIQLSRNCPEQAADDPGHEARDDRLAFVRALPPANCNTLGDCSPQIGAVMASYSNSQS